MNGFSLCSVDIEFVLPMLDAYAIAGLIVACRITNPGCVVSVNWLLYWVELTHPPKKTIINPLGPLYDNYDKSSNEYRIKNLHICTGTTEWHWTSQCRGRVCSQPVWSASTWYRCMPHPNGVLCPSRCHEKFGQKMASHMPIVTRQKSKVCTLLTF